MSATIHQLLRHHVSGAVARGTAAAIEGRTIHPAFTDAEVARMSASEQLHFIDAPVAHIVAEQDYRLAARREREMREFARVVSARRLAALAWG